MENQVVRRTYPEKQYLELGVAPGGHPTRSGKISEVSQRATRKPRPCKPDPTDPDNGGCSCWLLFKPRTKKGGSGTPKEVDP